MNAMTARGLSLAIVVAVWWAISDVAKVPLLLWPVIIGLACSLSAGGGVPGLQKTIAGTVSGVAWALVAAAVARSLGRQDFLEALVYGAAMFGIVWQSRFPLLGYTGGAMAGAAVALGAGARALQGGIRVAAALAIGAILAFAAERIAAALQARRV